LLSVWFLTLSIVSSTTNADIFRWDNGQLIPGTKGITLGPGVHLSNRQLEYARLSDIDLTGANFQYSDLTGADFQYSDLTKASLWDSNLTDANLSAATVTQAIFFRVTGFTKEQLYSTVSYRQKKLLGIRLEFSDFSGWDFTGQDLTGASFSSSNLTGANLTGATVTGADFAGTTSLNRMTGTVHGFTKEQLYSTASYQQKNLRGINLGGGRHPFDEGNDLTGWDFNGQDLAFATIGSSTLTDINLGGANLLNAWLNGSTLTGANLTAADMRGAQNINLSSTIMQNSIRPDGFVLGLELAHGDELVVRDDDGVIDRPPYGWFTPRQPIPINVRNHFEMSSGGVLRMILESDPWDSLISFQPAIPVLLGGTLDLTFADDVDVRTQVGRVLHLFDWTGVRPTGTFSIRSPYLWDLSHLYTTGEVTLLAIPEPTTVVLALFAAIVGVSICRRGRSRSPIACRACGLLQPARCGGSSQGPQF
jgi:uncharacterized protein YjbI with pentapeptide repeats